MNDVTNVASIEQIFVFWNGTIYFLSILLIFPVDWN